MPNTKRKSDAGSSGSGGSSDEANKKLATDSKSSGTVLLLGCGLVAPPLIHYLSTHGVSVIVASRTKSKTEKVIAGLKHVTAVEWDIDQKYSAYRSYPIPHTSLHVLNRSLPVL